MADERQTHRYPSPSPKQDSVSFTYTAQGHSQRLNQSSPDTMAASVTLPSIQDPRASSYGAAPPSVSGHGRPYPDTRYEAVRESPNGYPPHGQQQPPPAPPPTSHHPPPPQYQQPDPRSPAYPPPHDQRGYYPDPRAQAPYSHDPYRQEAYFYQAPPQAGYAPYGGDGRMHYGAPGQSQAQAAPRQRTSIACRYCRKRKVRPFPYKMLQWNATSLHFHNVDSLQRLPDCPWRQVPELCKNESGMHFSARIVLQLCSFYPCFRSSWRSATWYAAIWSVWPTSCPGTPCPLPAWAPRSASWTTTRSTSTATTCAPGALLPGTRSLAD